MQIIPLSTNILVKIMPSIEEKKGLLYTPQQTWRANYRCKVIACGPGKKKSATVRIPLKILPGEYVYITRYSGVIIFVDGQEFRFIKPIDVLAVESEE